MKHIAYTILALFAALGTNAQNMSQLFIVGDGVPGGVQQLTAFPGTEHKFAGALRQGTVRIRNTEEHKSTTYYLKPSYEDSYIVNNGLAYTLSRDSTVSNWVVPFSEEMFRFTVNTTARTLKGELFRPWNELFVVGGAAECGWEGHTFLPMTRLWDEVCTYQWTGELKERPEHGEPRRFKFAGQNAWEPKMLHPFTQDENILNSTQILTNGTADNKWSVFKNGYYRITIDVFRETIHAEYLGTTMPSASETAISTPTAPTATQDIYTLTGEKVSTPVPGTIVIQGGRKYLWK